MSALWRSGSGRLAAFQKASVKVLTLYFAKISFIFIVMASDPTYQDAVPMAGLVFEDSIKDSL